MYIFSGVLGLVGLVLGITGTAGADHRFQPGSWLSEVILGSAFLICAVLLWVGAEIRDELRPSGGPTRKPEPTDEAS